MQQTRYNAETVGKIISLHCRRSNTNRTVVVLDTNRLDQVFVYEQDTLEAVIAYLQDELNLDIVATEQLPVTARLAHHETTGTVYGIAHEDNDALDDFHAFFLPR